MLFLYSSRLLLLLLSLFVLVASTNSFGQFGDKQVIHQDQGDAEYLFIGAYDLNNDSIKELWYEKQGSDTTQVFLRKSGDGYEEVAVSTLLKTGNEWSVQYRGITVVDLNNDGLDEILYYLGFPDRKLFLLENQGNFNFSAPKELPITIRLSYFEDYDGDGLTDILSTEGSNLVWFKNLGGFSFSTSQVLADLEDDFYRIIFADIDNDETAELVAGNIEKIVIFQKSTEGYSEYQTITENVFETSEILASDLDMDGYVDLIVKGLSRVNDELQRLTLFRNNEGRLNNGTIIYDEGRVSEFVVIDQDEDGDNDLLLTVFDDYNFTARGDSRKYFTGTVWIENLGNEAFSLSSLLPFEGGSFIDIDQNGILDLVKYRNFEWVDFANFEKGVFIRDFLKEFSFYGAIKNIEPLQTDDQVGIIASFQDYLFVYKDVLEEPENNLIRSIPNQQFNPGLLSTGKNNAANEDIFYGYYRNLTIDGDRGIRIESLEFNSELDTYILKSDLQFEDFYGIDKIHSNFLNEDQLSDLILPNDNSDDASIYEQTEEGQFDNEVVSSKYVYDVISRKEGQSAKLLTKEGIYSYENSELTLSSFYGGQRFVDLDGDGSEDIVTVKSTEFGDFDESYWHENIDINRYSEKLPLSIEFEKSPSIHSQFFSDLDNDGDADFIKANTDGLYWQENTNGRGQFSAPELIDAISPMVIKTEDIDQDGDQDIVVGGEGYIYWYENQTVSANQNTLALTLFPVEAYANQKIKIPLKASGFEGLTELSFTINWDAEVASFQEVIPVSITDGEITQDAGNLTFSWANSAGQSFPQDATLIELVFQLSGEEGNNTSVQFAEGATAKNADNESVQIETTTGRISILVNTSPTDVTLSNNTVEENQSAGTLIGKLSTEDSNDSEGFTYALVAGEGDDDNDLFALDQDQLLTLAAFDFEERQQYSIRVQTTDSKGKSFQKAFAINVLDVDEDTNQAPTAITLSDSTVDENQEKGTLVGTLSTVDTDENDTHQYQLVEGEGSSDNELFTIQEDRLLTLEVFDFEEQENYTVRIQTEDEAGAKLSQSFTIAINDLEEDTNQPPTNITLTNSEADENLPTGSLVGKFLTEDEDDSEGFTYSFVEGEGDTNNELFLINNDQLLTLIPFDFEENTSYRIRVRTEDPQGKSFEKAFTIKVLDVDEATNQAPTAIVLSDSTVDENQEKGTLVGTLTTTDEDENDTHSYQLVSGEGSTGNLLFTIQENRLLTLEVFDFEAQNTYSIRIETQDDVEAKHSQSFTIVINNLEETTNADPTDILLSDQELLENVLPGTLVGTFSTTDADEDDEHTYTLVDGEGDEGNDQFSIKDNRLLTLVSFDYEAQPETSIRVRVSDGQGGTFEKSFTIAIDDVADDENQPPVDLILSGTSVDENQPSGTVVGTFSATDANDDNLTYTLVVGNGSTHNASFIIDGDQLQTAESFDYELRKRYSIRVQADDGRGGTVAEQFWIEVDNLDDAVNNAPTAIRLNNQRIEENQAAGTIVGAFSTQDRDEEDRHSYTLVTGARPNDNDLFYIQDNQLLTDAELDYEENKSLVVRVQTDDGSGGTFSTSFLIEVVNVEENLAPLSDNPLSDQVAAVSEEFTFSIPANAFSDQNQNDSLTYTVTLANGNALPTWLTFDPATLTLSGTPQESEELTIRVTATDREGAAASDEFILTIEGVTARREEVDKHYRIYPNPTKSLLTVATSTRSNRIRFYRIIDHTGRVVDRQKVVGFKPELKIEVVNLKSGSYYLELATDSNIYRKKILKQ